MFQIQKSCYGVFEGVMGEMGRMGVMGSAVKDLWKGFLFSVSLLLVGLFLSGCQTYAPEPIDLEGYGAAWKDRSFEVMPVGEWAENQSVSRPEENNIVLDPADGLSLSEGREIALRLNPGLRLVRAEAGIAEAKRNYAGLWDDPVLDALIGRKSPDGTSDELVVGAGMTITLPLSGRPAAERAVADANMNTSLAHIAQQEWQLVQDFETVWAAWSIQKEKVQLLTENLAIVADLNGRMTLLVQAGEIRSTEARALEVNFIKTRNLLERTKYEEQRTRLALSSMMGLHPKHDLSFTPEISGVNATVPAEDALDALVRQHPQVMRAQAEYEAAETALALEIRKQYPDIQLSPGFEDEGDESRLSLGLGIPTAVWNRNREGIATAQATREAARVRLEATYESTLAELMDTIFAFELAHMERVSIETGLAPLADTQLQEMQTLLNLGEMNLLLMRQSLSDVLEAKLSWLDARLAEAQAGIKLRSFEFHTQAPIEVTVREIEP